MGMLRYLYGGQGTTVGVRALLPLCKFRALLPLCKFCGLSLGFDGRCLFLLSHLIGSTVDSFLIKSYYIFQFYTETPHAPYTLSF